MRSTLAACIVVAFAGACADTGYGTGYGYGYGGYDSYGPDLVTVEPGVQVIADYDYPVFYNSGAYWRYDNNRWYRSRYYDRDWAYTSRPPIAVSRIRRPEAYVRYRPSNYNRGYNAYNRGYNSNYNRGYNPNYNRGYNSNYNYNRGYNQPQRNYNQPQRNYNQPQPNYNQPRSYNPQPQRNYNPNYNPTHTHDNRSHDR